MVSRWVPSSLTENEEEEDGFNAEKLFCDFGASDSYTYGDIVFIPAAHDHYDSSPSSPNAVSLCTAASRNIPLSLPVVSTVADSLSAAALASAGGIGIVDSPSLLGSVKSLKPQPEVISSGSTVGPDGCWMVGAAIGASEKRLEEFVKAGADVVVLDHITDWNEKIEMIKLVKQSYPGLDVVCGDVLTVNQARRLIAAGVDGLRVGIGRAQASAVYKIGRVAAQSGVPVMAYGNWKEAAVGAHNNIVKALVLGSSTVITENIIEQTLEEFIIPYTLQVVKQGFHYLGASSLNSAHHLLRSHSLRLELRTPSSQEEIRRRDKLMGDKSSLHY